MDKFIIVGNSGIKIPRFPYNELNEYHHEKQNLNLDGNIGNEFTSKYIRECNNQKADKGNDAYGGFAKENLNER